MSTDTTERSLALLSLLSSRRGWTGTELAERLEVTDRTLRRDIERLRLLGYEIDGTRGTAGGYALRAGAEIPPLFLDDDEAVAVTAAVLVAIGDGATGMGDATSRALGKLHQVLPAKVLRRIAAVDAATWAVRRRVGPTVDPLTVAALAEAARDHVRVRFDYRARDGQVSSRRVEPHSIVTPGTVWYLIGYDLDRDDWRLFRIDRTSALELTGHGAEARELPGGDPAAFLARGIVRTPTAHRARVDVPRSVEDLRAAHPDLLADRIRRRSARRCSVELGADTLDELALQIVRVLQVADGCTVDAPDDVRRHLDATAAHLARAAGIVREADEPEIAAQRVPQRRLP